MEWKIENGGWEVELSKYFNDKNLQLLQKMLFQTVSPDKRQSIQINNKNQAPKPRLSKLPAFKRKREQRQKTILDFRKDLFDRFQQFNMAQSFSKVYKMFEKSIGRHSPTYYDAKYNFKQQWEVSNKAESKQQYNTSFIYGCISFLILLIINFSIFGISIKIFFEIQHSEWVYFLVMGICFVEIAKKFNYILSIPLLQRLKAIVEQVICILISLILVLTSNSFKFFESLGLLIILLLYRKSCKLYKFFKIFHLSSQYRQFVEIIDLFALLLTISHIFALLLYGTTLLHPDNNWMTRINIDDLDWITKYIYSLYFSCTTLLTVGYGDVSPTNVAEILTILLTQLIGIATFAYAVNKIGAALTNITERAQRMQKNLGNVQHIGNSYRLKPDIVCRMRTELIKDKTLVSEMNLNEENELFSKFSEDLRQQISVESSMRVIKRSMFMIGNWTGKLQYKIARKLVKQIYAIDQFLPQTQGKEKIYILDKGKIDVINNARSGFKVCFQKVLKSMTIFSNNEVVVENVYGYSFVISNRHIHLNAVAKLNSICYSLSKSDLFQLLAESEEDLEHFHELKSKIDLSKIPEEVEAPSIINFREHYCPSVHYIIAAHYCKKNKQNDRVSAIRKKRRVNMQIYDKHYASESYIGGKDKKFKSFYIKDEIADELDEKLDSIFRDDTVDLVDQIFGFQSCRDYQRYYKKSNYEQVIRRLKMRVCKVKTSAKY